MPHRYLLPLLLALCPTAQAWEAPADDGEWQVVINFPMVWLPDISGEIKVDGEVTSIDIPIEDVLDNLDTGFIGELHIARGRWGLGWRSMFLGTESSSVTEEVTGLPGRPPIVGRHRVTVEAELFTSDLILSYGLSERLGFYSGVRRTGSKADFRIKPIDEGLVNLRGKYNVMDEEMWDWLVGVTLGHRFNDHWSVHAQLDTSVDGDNDTNRQVNAFFSYEFNARHSAWFGYRYLEIGSTTRQDGSRVKNEFTQQGPTFGWAFTF